MVFDSSDTFEMLMRSSTSLAGSKNYFKRGSSNVNLVYHLHRYIDDCSPMCVYLPSNEVMFKMMKACLYVQRVEDLWIYQAPKDEIISETGSLNPVDEPL